VVEVCAVVFLSRLPLVEDIPHECVSHRLGDLGQHSLSVHLGVGDGHPVRLVVPRRNLAVIRQARIVRHNACAVLAARRNRLRYGLSFVLAQVVDDLETAPPKGELPERHAFRNRLCCCKTQRIVRRFAELVVVFAARTHDLPADNLLGHVDVLLNKRLLLLREPHVNLRLECPQKRPATRRIVRPSHSRRT
jgi:hypothetical protein